MVVGRRSVQPKTAMTGNDPLDPGQLSIAPFGVAKSSTSFGCGKCGKVTHRCQVAGNTV